MKLVHYRNRRYYSPDLSRYVNAPEIIEMVRHGVGVRIECHRTRNDITAQSLVRILAQYRPNNLDVASVVELIRRGA